MTRIIRQTVALCLTGMIAMGISGCGGGNSTASPALSPAEVKARDAARDQAAALKLPLTQTLEVAPDIKLELVFIPKGELALQADSDAGATVLKVDAPFYMSKYEITQMQYAAVMDDNPGMVMGPDQPVNQITWQHAQTFCEKVGARNKQTLALPTSTQWEFACRAFSTTPFYSGENDQALGEIAWFRANSEGLTHPVGKKKPNAFGLYDMLGNVTEWCADAPTTPPKADEPAVDRRILRGGSWLDFPKMCRAGSQAIAPSSFLNANIGFRVVMKIITEGRE